MNDQDPDQSKRSGLPPHKNKTPASPQDKGKSIASQSDPVNKKPFPLFPFGAPISEGQIPKYATQQEDGSSPPNYPIMFGSSSQFPSIPNLPNSVWAEIWTCVDSQLVQSMVQKPYDSWTIGWFRLAARRRMQLMLQLLPPRVDKILNSGSVVKASDYSWVGELVTADDRYSKEIEADFVSFSSKVGLEQIGDCLEKGIELNTEALVNELSNRPIPVGTIWSDTEYPEVQSLQQTPYFLWSDPGLKLALPILRRLQLTLIQVKIAAGQIPPLPGQQDETDSETGEVD